MDILLEMFYVAVVLITIWYLWYRNREHRYAASYIELIIFSCLLILWGLVPLINENWQSFLMNIIIIFSLASLFRRFAGRVKEVGLKIMIKENFQEEYGFRGFFMLMFAGFGLFLITAVTHTLTGEPIFAIIFGIPGILAVLIGLLGVIYAYIRYFLPMLLSWFRKDNS
ncbi:hypothetical protein [Dethiobacter alkaliphilus]|uniref:hypothetical protein n=1 Tax=Dethiobacter alkaliphilus TaxID=427926 RepID=UPI0022277795|nr:hypothetical protein [Dethiobacter alkaliphilus]MCW3490385.1 hypothetical protein [Dethiobacter alkaliphilus]